MAALRAWISCGSRKRHSRNALHDLVAEDQEQQDQRQGDDHHSGHHGGDVFPAKAVFPDGLDAVGDQEEGGVAKATARKRFAVM